MFFYSLVQLGCQIELKGNRSPQAALARAFHRPFVGHCQRMIMMLQRVTDVDYSWSICSFHYRQSYRSDAAQDAWQAMQAWFKKYKVLD
jgi:dienelactone hydrolase